ncbi:MAG: hypothetical protein O2854_04405 [Chloroflexi bacterium]|nr:hypothetical protein [Chloroflexota bacterium]
MAVGDGATVASIIAVGDGDAAVRVFVASGVGEDCVTSLVAATVGVASSVPPQAASSKAKTPIARGNKIIGRFILFKTPVFRYSD